MTAQTAQRRSVQDDRPRALQERCRVSVAVLILVAELVDVVSAIEPETGARMRRRLGEVAAPAMGGGSGPRPRWQELTRRSVHGLRPRRL